MMSDAQAILTEARAAIFSDYFDVAVTALVAYEYIVTIDSELLLFWKPCRINAASILFLLNRYINLSFLILNWTPLPADFERYRNLAQLELTIAVSNYVAFYLLRYLRYLPWAGFSALRVFALFPGPTKHRYVASGAVFVLSLLPLMFFLPALIRWTHYTNDPLEGVIPVVSEPDNIRTAITGRASLSAAEFFVLCITWYRTYETIKISRHHGVNDNKSFASTLLRDGTIFFMPMLIFNVLYIAFTQTSIAVGPWGKTSIMLVFGEQLTSVLTGRFLINLQKVKRRLARSTLPGSDTLVFQPSDSAERSDGFIGSLGSPISFHDDIEEEGLKEDEKDCYPLTDRRARAEQEH